MVRIGLSVRNSVLITSTDDDGPDSVSVQVCPHRSHQLSGAVETHLEDIPTSETLESESYGFLIIVYYTYMNYVAGDSQTNLLT